MKMPVPCRLFALTTAALAVAIPLHARAEVSLFDYAFLQDGVLTAGPSPVPPGSLFDLTTGLGVIRMTFAGAGSHSALLFVDHELSEAENTFFNELGSTSVGAPPAGLSWEIDEPGFSFGDIYDHVVAGSLDNTIGSLRPDDVSMALGWDFALAEGEAAEVLFHLGETPPSGFYLRHFDPDSGESVFFSSSLSITTTAVPEGGTVLAGLMGVALTLATTRHRRRPGKPSPTDHARA